MSRPVSSERYVAALWAEVETINAGRAADVARRATDAAALRYLVKATGLPSAEVLGLAGSSRESLRAAAERVMDGGRL